MRAAGIATFGQTVRLTTVPHPRRLAPDEVLIEIKAAGVGNWDEFARVGDWDIGRRPPMALGSKQPTWSQRSAHASAGGRPGTRS